MSKFMSVAAELKRLVEDENAPCAARVLALKQIEHPPLCLLRRLLVKNIHANKTGALALAGCSNAEVCTRSCAAQDKASEAEAGEQRSAKRTWNLTHDTNAGVVGETKDGKGKG
jgi:hypothetical protein